jgi:hypothetical protein
MPRRHRRELPDDDFSESIERLKSGFRRVEHRRGETYIVQPISARSARKEYRCPGCSLVVAVGTAHVVAWQEDSIMGVAQAVADRRHWHTHCWKIF